MTEKTKTLVPPYISWRTTATYIQSLQQAFPSRIDTSGMIRLAGGIRAPMLNTLKFLKLIRDDGTPEPILRELVEASTPDKKGQYSLILNRVLESAYPTIFDEASDLANMTPKQFAEKFEKLGISGDTVRKAETFFLDAAKEAGVKVSPIVLDARKHGPKAPRQGNLGKGKKKNQENGGSGASGGSGGVKHDTPPEIVLPQWYVTFKAAFDKLPDFEDPRWRSGERERWISLITALVDLYVEVDDE